MFCLNHLGRCSDIGIKAFTTFCGFAILPRYVLKAGKMTDNVFKFLWKYLSKLKFLFFAVLLSVIFGEACVRIALYYASFDC